ncbi:EF-hand domain-containing protein [Rhizobium sullae]|uniref:EF hand domain-containing protein n=1 Tax=Rhizobium sullae TaxID=50338 RepID=A0A4V2V7Z8_RHISU|nr:EF-hand domain-containing protein [Rhizobium sullae]TCU08623.1 EF hand domain-containing protein [Rhizobium sullae]
MTTTRLPHAAMLAMLATLIAVGGAGVALSQTNEADPHHPATSAQASEADEGTTGQGQGAMPGGPGMMPGGMMGRGMMSMPMMDMRGHMMKIMFAVADSDGDGALSFEEVTTIHKRIFNSVDADKNGKVTPEEMQAFMRE